MSSAGHYGPDGRRHLLPPAPYLAKDKMAEVELDKIDETVDSARRVIQHVAAHGWEREMRQLCQAWLDTHPEPGA